MDKLEIVLWGATVFVGCAFIYTMWAANQRRRRIEKRDPEGEARARQELKRRGFE